MKSKPFSKATKNDKNVIVKFENVNKYFGDLHVLNDINLEVTRNEVLVIIGPSGSGKSTLLRSINHLETAAVSLSSAACWAIMRKTVN
jgi:ABC-type phosphate transport system ATPase subunit